MASASALNVKVQGKTYPIEQLLDKTIYAGRVTKLYPRAGGTALFQVNPGGIVGKLYSWVFQPDDIYLMFYTNANSIREKYGYPGQVTGSVSYFAKLSDINNDGLADQGTKTTKEITEEQKKAEEEANKSFTDKALSTGFNLGVTALVVWGLVSFAKSKL